MCGEVAGSVETVNVGDPPGSTSNDDPDGHTMEPGRAPPRGGKRQETKDGNRQRKIFLTVRQMRSSQTATSQTQGKKVQKKKKHKENVKRFPRDGPGTLRGGRRKRSETLLSGKTERRKEIASKRESGIRPGEIYKPVSKRATNTGTHRRKTGPPPQKQPEVKKKRLSGKSKRPDRCLESQRPGRNTGC